MASAPEIKQKFHQVLCDMCQDKQTPALRTCLKCEISMCEEHLQAHLTTPVLLQTHPLTKPTAPEGLRSQTVRCQEHGKLLEYYCMDDHTCVCVSCSIEGQHHLHNKKTLSSAHKVLVENLKMELKDLAERETQGKALRHWEMNQTKALEESGENLVKELATLRNTGLTKVQNSVVARLRTTQIAREKVDTALSEEDSHVFLQKYAELHEAVDRTRTVDFVHGLEKNTEQVDVVSNILKYGSEAMKNVKKLQRSLLVLVDPCKQHWGETKPTNVTFDPNGLGGLLRLSLDHKTLYCYSLIQQYSQKVFLKNDIKSADLSWAIQFSDKYNWSVGLCDENVYDGQGTIYGIEWADKQMMEINTEKDKKTQNNAKQLLGAYNLFSRSNPFNRLDFQNKLHIQWVHTSQTLLFFIRGECDEMICLHSVNVEHYDQLRPFVSLYSIHDHLSSNHSNRNRQYHGPTSQYADFVCALDNENLVTLYSHGQISKI